MGKDKGAITTMLNSLLNAFFGCSHRRTSFPLTPARRAGVPQGNEETRSKTYVTCLDCGKEFDYDWDQMRVGSAKSGIHTVVAPQTFTVHSAR